MQLDELAVNLVQRLFNANVERTRYMLLNYLSYSKQQPGNVDVKTSRSIIGIIADSMGNSPDFRDADKMLIDECGSVIFPGLFQILTEIREFPWGLGQNAYVILYEKYFHDDGDTTTLQIKERLHESEITLSQVEIEEQLDIAERMMTALIFENKLLYAAAFGAAGIQCI